MMVVGSGSGVDRAVLERQGADATLVMPLIQDALLRALVEVLSVPSITAGGQGRPTGLEPATSWTTTRCSAN